MARHEHKKELWAPVFCSFAFFWLFTLSLALAAPLAAHNSASRSASLLQLDVALTTLAALAEVECLCGNVDLSSAHHSRNTPEARRCAGR